MDWLQFLSSLVGHLAWPAVVAYLLYLLRDQLMSLAARVEEITLPGGAKAKFEKQLAKAAETADKIEPRQPHPEPKQLQSEKALADEYSFLKLAEAFPPGAVIEEFKSIEKLLLEITQYLPEVSKRRSTHLAVQRLLDLNLITEDAYELYQTLREARNAAAHSVSDQAITFKDAIDYNEKAKVLIGVLEGVFESLKKAG